MKILHKYNAHNSLPINTFNLIYIFYNLEAISTTFTIDLHRNEFSKKQQQCCVHLEQCLSCILFHILKRQLSIYAVKYAVSTQVFNSKHNLCFSFQVNQHNCSERKIFYFKFNGHKFNFQVLGVFLCSTEFSVRAQTCYNPSHKRNAALEISWK